MTSIHDGVTCNSCRKNGFRGLRYKCLICYDYDLCSTCYDAGITSSRHTTSHPVQCIIARSDYDLFYSGEQISSDHPQSLTCPVCGILGFSESTLLDHVTNEHPSTDGDESSSGVVCPICGSETNQLTYDFPTHLTMEHRAPRDQIESATIRGRGGRCHTSTRGPRGRRAQQHYSAVGGPSGSPPSTRDSTDPLVEILAQLSGVRRAGGVSTQSPASQLHQLQLQMLQTSPAFSTRAGNDSREVRIMRRTFQTMNNHLNNSSTSTSTGVQGGVGGVGGASNSSCCSNQPFVLMDQSSLGGAGIISNSSAGTIGPVGAVAGGLPGAATQSGGMPVASAPPDGAGGSQYLLSRCMKPILSEVEQQQKEVLNSDRSLFVQELILQLGSLEKQVAAS